MTVFGQLLPGEMTDVILTGTDDCIINVPLQQKLSKVIFILHHKLLIPMFFVIPTSFFKMAEKRKKQTNKQTPKQLKLRK